MLAKANLPPILVVEDSDDDFEVTERALKRMSNVANPIVRCETGEKALHYLLSDSENGVPTAQQERPAIILLDLNMPGVGGRALLEMLKKKAGLREIPVVILTTSDNEKDVESCYNLGANTYITKPVDLEGFFNAIKHLTEYWFDIAVLPKN